jgi:predicted transcriptional regulator of viral defense system
VKASEAYGDLLRMGRKVMTTREAAARWRTSTAVTTRRLGGLEKDGLVLRLRRGLWAIDPQIKPITLAPYLTAPLPAYVSLFSALYEHGAIEQIPRSVSVISLDRTREIETAISRFSIHHIAPELFGGFEGDEEQGYLATVEKAIFDLAYIRAAAGSKAFFPELHLTRKVRRAELRRWTQMIESRRLQTLVSRNLRAALSPAEGAAHDRSRIRSL